MCPQCNKPRLKRPLDFKASLEKKKYKTKDNSEVELLVDICEFCQTKNYHKYFEPTRADIKKIMKAMKEEAQLREGESLEDLL